MSKISVKQRLETLKGWISYNKSTSKPTKKRRKNR